ncbi:MAG TPA: serine/threonine protein kinase, partial [Allocoleopsis sp.]
EQKKAALRILSSLVSPAYMTAPTLLPLIILEMVNLSFTYGNDPLSSFAYGLYGLLLSGVLGDIDTGYQFGKLALNIVEKFQANYLKTKINYTVGAHILYGKHHLKEVLPLLKEGYAKGLETADLEMGYSAKEISQISYLMGKELTELEKEINTYSQALIHVKQYAALNYNRIIHQVVLNLLGNQPDNCRFLGEVYNEEEMLPLHESASDRNGLHYFYFHKMIICYLFGENDQALINAQEAEKYLDAVTGMINVPMFYFYDALIRLAIYPKLDSIEKAKYWEKIEYNQEKIEVYATHSPENFLHKFYLIEAEKLRVMNQNVQALEAYKQAIILAADNNYINEEAIAQELITKVYLSLGKVKVAQTYMIDAYYNYANWGAKAKIEQLEKTYPQLLMAIVQQNQNNILHSTQITTITSSTSGTSQKILDLSSILKASQAISQEIVLENLLSTLMQIVIENAGAEKGVLILAQSTGLFVEVIASNNPIKINLLPSVSLYASNEVPISIINYCYRSQETLLF